MKWYYINFDPSWVTCKNYICNGTFILKNVEKRRKCPICKNKIVKLNL